MPPATPASAVPAASAGPLAFSAAFETVVLSFGDAVAFFALPFELALLFELDRARPLELLRPRPELDRFEPELRERFVLVD